MIIAALVVTAFFLTACAPEPFTPRQTEIQTLIAEAKIDQSPEKYQAAIDKAIELYNIDTQGVQPTYDSNMEEGSAGKTTVSGGEYVDGVYVGGEAKTKIGPEAFSSPDQLVGTIAHEAFHVRQFREVRWYEESEGVILNEVEAYRHVISRKEELELSRDTIKNSKTMISLYRRVASSSIKRLIDKDIYTLPRHK